MSVILLANQTDVGISPIFVDLRPKIVHFILECGKNTHIQHEGRWITKNQSRSVKTLSPITSLTLVVQQAIDSRGHIHIVDATCRSGFRPN